MSGVIDFFLHFSQNLMLEKAMVQIRVRLNLCKSKQVAGGLEGRQPPSMMIEEVLIQIGVQSIES